MPSVNATSVLILGLILALIYLAYRSMLPGPIRGIPYNPTAAKSLLGDLPALLKNNKLDPGEFLVSQCVKLGSPIVQLFVRPLQSPWVVIADFQEANDILTRRTRDFDRSEFFGDLFITLLPDAMVHLPTGEQWKSHRRLMNDLMASTFLNNTISVHIVEGTQELISLWREKQRLIGDHPFSAKSDLSCSALDIIWVSTFGSKIGVTPARRTALENTSKVTIKRDQDAPFEFDVPAMPAAFHSIIKLTQSFEIPAKIPFPRLAHRLALMLIPSLRAARQHKDLLIEEQLDEALRQFSYNTDDSNVKSSIDLLVQREMAMVEKGQKQASQDWKVVKDELFGLLIAGHDTTATTVCWGLKFLAMHSTVQDALRNLLLQKLKTAATEKRSPTATEIVRMELPYLEAVIEEIHRCGHTSSFHIRQATCDTQVLGYAIPKGTQIFLHTHGPSFGSPAFSIDDKKRSETSSRHFDRPAWSSDDVAKFKPERWLVKGDDGVVRFNSRAGPALPFGAGPRGCFGRKLASLQLKIMLSMILWNFKLLPTPPSLSSMAQHEVLTSEPEQCFVRLEKVEH